MRHPFKVSGDLDIEKNGRCFLNAKRITLLKLIEHKGSINAASKAMRMSYQQAWHFIKEMNEISPLPLVVRKRGGKHGGGAILTNYGKETVVEFEKILQEHEEFKHQLSEKLWLCFF